MSLFGRPRWVTLILLVALSLGLALGYATPVSAQPPINDTCAGALTIPAGGPFPYLTTAVDVTNATQAPEVAFACSSSGYYTIWYAFTPSSGGMYRITTCPTQAPGTTRTDTVLGVYTSTGGCAGTFTSIACNDDDSGCSGGTLRSTVTPVLTAGTTYYIQAASYSTTAPPAGASSIQLYVNQVVGPSNDTCSAPIALTLNRAVNGTTQDAADDYELVSGSTCFTGLVQTTTTAPGRDVVYSFTAPATDNYSFRTQFSTGGNGVLYLASSCPTATPGTPQIVSCTAASNRNTGTSNSAEELMCVSLTAGQTVYLFVDELALSTSGTAFRLEVTRCAQETEDNNTPGVANSIACGIEGSINPTGDIDYFSLGTPTVGSRVFAMADQLASNSADNKLRITTSADTLAFDDDGLDTPYGSVSANVAGVPLTGVASYVQVQGYSSSTLYQPYRVYSVVQPPIGSSTAESEPNDATTTADYGPTNYFNGTLTSTTDFDYYVLTAAAGDLIFASVDGDPGRDATPINPILALLDGAGAQIVSVNDSGSTSSTTSGVGNLLATTPYSPEDSLWYRVGAGGTFYVRVGLSATTTNSPDYLLSISKNCNTDAGLSALPTADLAVTKTDSPDPVPSGNNLTYTINVTNNGPGSSVNATLTDVVPAGTTFLSVKATLGGTCSTPPVGGTGTVTCTWSALNVETATVTLVVTVTAPTGSVISNTATVSSATTTDPVSTNNSAAASTTVTPALTSADLSIAKSLTTGAPFIAGGNLTYAIVASNAGPADANNLAITDVVPTNTRFVSATPSAGASCSTPAVGGTGTVTCTWAGGTPPGTTRTLNLVVRTCSELACNSSVSNTASVSSPTQDSNTANNTTPALMTTLQTQSSLTITKGDSPDPVIAGQNVTYNLVVRNAGPSNAANVVVVDTLPSNTTFVSASSSPAGATCTAAGKLVTCNLGILGYTNQCATSYAQQYTITIVAAVSDLTPSSVSPCTGSPLANGATVASGNCVADTGTLSASATTGVLAGADVLVDPPVVTTDDECIGPGATLKVAQTFGNTGPRAYTPQWDNFGPEFSVALPASVVGVPGSCVITAGTGTCQVNTGQVLWNGTMAVGETVAIEYEVRVKGGVTFGTEMCFGGTASYDQCNTLVNTATRSLDEPICVTADCESIITPNKQLGMQVHLPIMSFLGQDPCEVWIEVQDIGPEAVKAVLVTWGEAGFCPPQAAGPLKVECTGLLKPGTTWNMLGDQIPDGSKSGMLFKFSTKQLSDFGLDETFGFDDILADLMCETLFFGVVGDADDFRRFKKAYNEGGLFAGIPQDIASGAAEGGILAVDVLRTCDADKTPGAKVTSKYGGIAGSHLGEYDPVYGGYTYYVPLVYAKRGDYSTWAYIQNGGLECSSVEIWLKAQDDCLRAQICEVSTLAPGETLQFDPNTCVGPGWIGSAWVRTSQPMGIAVDIWGNDILMTYVGEPAELNYTFDPGQAVASPGNQVAFGPLTYSEYQGWDSGIQVQNLSPAVAAKVKVYFLDRSGDVITTLIDWICPRGSQTFFLPVVSALPGNWVGSVRVESQEWLTPGGPRVLAPNIVAVATLIKYADTQRTATQEAIAYNLLPEHKIFDWQLGGLGAGGLEGGVGLIAIPSLLSDVSGTGVASELAIANVVPKPGFTDFLIYLYDQNGLLDYVCEKLNEKQVEYIDFGSWGYINDGFKGSAIISAYFWEHDVFDDTGFFLRNLVGLGAVSVERSRTTLGKDIPGDEAAGDRGIPFKRSDIKGEEFGFGFLGDYPICPGLPDQRPKPGECPAEVVIACNNCPVPIPDVSTATGLLESTVPAGCKITDVDVQVDISHTYDADMTATLIDPAGLRVPLFASICGASDGIQAILDDEATAAIGSVCPPAGFLRYNTVPAGGLTQLEGLSTTGTWTLEIRDTVGGDSGTINGWELQFKTK